VIGLLVSEAAASSLTSSFESSLSDSFTFIIIKLLADSDDTTMFMSKFESVYFIKVLKFLLKSV
jgi:hypothetical protein